MYIPSGASDIIMHKFRFWRSLKLRLFILIFIAGLVPSLIIYQSILKGYEDRAVKVRTLDVQNQLTVLADHLITYNYLIDPSSDVVNAELNLLSNLYSGRVMVINSRLKIVRDTYGISEGRSMVSEEVVKCLKGSSINNYDRVNGYIELTVPITETISSVVATDEIPEGTVVYRGVLLASTSTDTIITTMEILRKRAQKILLIVIILLVAIAITMSMLLVRPFDMISRQIESVKSGTSDEPLTVRDYLETQHIVSSFNSLFARMKKVDESRREFVSNVSHELKTPLTSVKILADSLNTDNDVPVEVYKEFMADITQEIEREDKIINDLLELVRLDKDASKLNISSVDINALSEIILKRMRPIARKNEIELTLVSLRDVVAEVDEVKISLVLTNLVENAIKYNSPGGTATVTVDADHQFFTIEVSDTGEGIPEEELDSIFERFYRVDKSHSSKIGGTGLGLSITRSAVLLHKGTIEVKSEPGKGSTFTVKIPIKASV